jgi:cobalamin biosynthetic protein CobC
MPVSFPSASLTLRAAARHYGIPPADWLDLSTAINPDAYPVPPIDPACWSRLPEDDDGLEAAAAAYYGNDRLLVLPGAQAAIQALPTLFAPAAVACVTPLDDEHPQAWERAGHRLRRLPTLPRALAAATPNVVLCNPGALTATTLPRADLLAAAEQLRQRGGWLIVDEALADAEPDNGVAALAGSDAAPKLIVLRELGFFFGLAGARVGFVFASAEKLAGLRRIIGRWPVSHPARAAAQAALRDCAWQAATRRRLGASSQRLAGLLAGLGEVKRTALVCTLSTPHVAALFEHFARRAILTRCFAEHGLLRLGLPGGDEDWQRLSAAVADWNPPC